MLPKNNTIIFNGRLIEDEINIDTIIYKSAAYEVIRLVKGYPLFFKDHILRLFASLDLSDTNNKYFTLLSEKFKDLVENKSLIEGNIRIDAWLLNKDFNFIIRQIPHNYPQENDYKNGVKLSILHAERSNPNKKVRLPSLRSQADELIALKKVHEVLLINQNNEITEGSRSNVFFVKGNTIITPPNKQVLEGITRKYVIKAIKEHTDIIFIEKAINLDNLSEFDAVFLTGTSLNILPIKSIDSLNFNPKQTTLIRLMQSFQEIL
ncbi:MAG: aminotransferase class IV, partial [Bacteroidales bacterium]|nr:aminotransferase class IV [Bacteroidales bacterium]